MSKVDPLKQIEGEAYSNRFRWLIFLQKSYYFFLILTLTTPLFLPLIGFVFLFITSILIGGIILWLNDSRKISERELNELSFRYLKEYVNPDYLDLVKFLTNENKYLREAASKILNENKEQNEN